jgi:uracil-DNA glycosylase family 4
VLDELAGIMAADKMRRYPSAHCSICPLADRPLVPSLLIEDAQVMVIGEGPGNNEVTQERPFVGESGYILEQSLSQVTDYDRVALSNTVLCSSMNNDKPGYKAMLACRDRLLEEIQQCNPKVVVAAGGAALSSLEKSDKLKITRERGRERTYRIGTDEYTLVPTFHPAYMGRNPGAFTDFARDLSKAVRISNGEAVADAEHVLPVVRISTSVWETLQWLEWIEQFETDIAVDIETASRLNRIRFGEDKIISIAFSVGEGHGRVRGAVVTLRRAARGGCVPRDAGERDVRLGLSEWEVRREAFVREIGRHRPEHQGHAHRALLPGRAQGHARLEAAVARRPGRTRLRSPAQGMAQDREGAQEATQQRRAEGDDASGQERHATGTKSKAQAPTLKPDGSAYTDADLLNEDLTYDDVPKDMLYLYQGYDVAYTMRLDRLYMPRIREQDLEGLFAFMMRANRALMKMEMHGVLIDTSYRDTLEEALTNDIDALMVQMREMAGEDFDPNSPKKLAAVLFTPQEEGGLGIVPPPRTKKTVHGWSTAKDVLEEVEAQHPIVSLVKDHRGLSKLKGSYVVRLDRFLYADGRIRPDYRQHGTVTGRMSEPIMTWPKPDPKSPKKPHIRNLAIAPEGKVFLEGDAAAGELRIMAALSGEPLWVDAFNQGRDVHNEVMLELGFGDLQAAIAEMGGDAALGEKLYDKKRRDIKIVNFGVAYGMEENLLAKILKWPVWQAKTFLRDYWARHATLYGWLEEVKKQAIETGMLRSPFGRYRRYGLITRPVVKAVRNEAGNFLPQSILSDTMLWATTQLVEEYWDQGVRPILFVHDAAGIECPTPLATRVAIRFGQIVAETFRNVVWPVSRAHVDMLTDFKVGRSWGQARKWKPGDALEIAA